MSAEEEVTGAQILADSLVSQVLIWFPLAIIVNRLYTEWFVKLAKHDTSPYLL